MVASRSKSKVTEARFVLFGQGLRERGLSASAGPPGSQPNAWTLRCSPPGVSRSDAYYRGVFLSR